MSRQNKQDVYEMRVQKAALDNDLAAIESILDIAKSKRVATPLLSLASVALMVRDSIGFMSKEKGAASATGVCVFLAWQSR